MDLQRHRTSHGSSGALNRSRPTKLRQAVSGCPLTLSILQASEVKGICMGELADHCEAELSEL